MSYGSTAKFRSHRPACSNQLESHSDVELFVASETLYFAASIDSLNKKKARHSTFFGSVAMEDASSNGNVSY